MEEKDPRLALVLGATGKDMVRPPWGRETRARVLAWVETQEAAAAKAVAAEDAPAERAGGAGTRSPAAVARVARNGLPVAVQMAVRRRLEKAERRKAPARKRRRQAASSG